MKKLFFVWTALMMLLAACGSNQSMDMKRSGDEHGSGMQMGDKPAVTVGGLEIYAPMAMSGMKAQTTGGFMMIKNTGATADRLLIASCEAARMTQIHETVMDGDVMKMREVAGIEIPAGGMVELKHGGYHVMLMDLKQDVKAGETTTCTLKFENAGEVKVDFPVMSR